eukprot:c39233_g1_i1 orf=577-807(-)
MYIFRVRLASFMAGFASATVLGLYYLRRDLHVSHQFLAQQAEGYYSSLEARISLLERSTNGTPVSTEPPAPADQTA